MATPGLPRPPWPRSASTQPPITVATVAGGKVLLGGKRHQGLAQLFGRSDLPSAELVEQGAMAQGDGQGVVLCHPPGRGDASWLLAKD